MRRAARRLPDRWSAALRTAFGVALLCLCSPGLLPSQDRSFPRRESFTLDVPLPVGKQFENVRSLIEQQAWDAAFTALAQLTDDSPAPDALVTVAPGRYLNTQDAARLLTTALPPAGLAAYREQIDGWAEQRFQDAVAAHDEQSLRRLLRDAYASSWGDDALWMLGEWLWERGETSLARQCWKQLLPSTEVQSGTPPQTLHCPDPQMDAAEVQARLVLCSLADSNRELARRELGEMQRKYPDAVGFIAGRRGPLTDLLEELLEQPGSWTPATTLSDWPTYARLGTRNAFAASCRALAGPQWMIPLAPVAVPNWERERSALPAPSPLSRYPAADAGGLYFHDGVSIRAVQLADGRPRWPVGEESDIGDVYPPFNVLPIRPVLRPTVGVPRFTTTIHDGHLYALTGPSVLTLPESGLRASPTRLVCLDIEAGEGLLKWFRTAEDLFPPGWMMTGTPIAAGNRLYLPLLRTDPQLEPAVACLAASDGSAIWIRSLGQALTEPLHGRVELGHQLLAVCDGTIYFSTDLGVVAALDAATSGLRWATTYPSDAPPALTRSNEASYGLLPPVCSDGRVFVKPNDYGALLALDGGTGAILWRCQAPSRIVHILAASGADVLVSGDQLWAVDVDSGEIRWRFGFDDPGGFGYGRGAVAGTHVFWTTRDDLFVIDRLSGQALQRYPLRELLQISGGNILLAEDRLVIAGPDHITAFALSPP